MILSCAIICPIIVYGKQVWIKIIDAEKENTIAKASVINKRTKTVLYTNPLGIVTAEVQLGDTLMTYAQGYNPEEYLVKDSTSDTLVLSILSDADSEKTVIVNGSKDTVWKHDTARIHQNHISNPYFTGNGVGMSGAVSKLAGLFSSKQKKREELKKEMDFYESTMKSKSRYNDSLVRVLTKMPDDSIAEFRKKYPINADFEKNASDLELMSWIRNNYKLWRRIY